MHSVLVLTSINDEEIWKTRKIPSSKFVYKSKTYHHFVINKIRMNNKYIISIWLQEERKKKERRGEEGKGPVYRDNEKRRRIQWTKMPFQQPLTIHNVATNYTTCMQTVQLSTAWRQGKLTTDTINGCCTQCMQFHLLRQHIADQPKPFVLTYQPVIGCEYIDFRIRKRDSFKNKWDKRVIGVFG